MKIRDDLKIVLMLREIRNINLGHGCTANEQQHQFVVTNFVPQRIDHMFTIIQHISIILIQFVNLLFEVSTVGHDLYLFSLHNKTKMRVRVF